MARIKMHIPKAKLPFYPPYEVKYRLQNGVSTTKHYNSNVRHRNFQVGDLVLWKVMGAAKDPS